MSTLNHRSVILTGGGGDIAREVASQLVSRGASVLLVDLDESRLQGVVEALGGDSVSYCVADVTSEADTQAYVAAAVERYGGVDVLFANAGIEGSVTPVSEYSVEEFEKVQAVNVTGPFLGIKHVFPVMAAGGGGSIVITSSIAGLKGTPGCPPTPPASTRSSASCGPVPPRAPRRISGSTRSTRHRWKDG